VKTTAVEPEDLSGSVIAVPPLARRPDLSIDDDANRALVMHMRDGGVSTFLYGGNANFYNIGLYEYARILDGLAQWAGTADLVIPSVGPAYGTLMDQAPILRERAFPTAMVLPATMAATPAGIMTGIQRFVDNFGRPIVLYIKSETYLAPADIAALVGDGAVSFIKYAIVRDDPADDAFLADLVQRVPPRMIVSGMGEQPAPVHMESFGLAGFTSGLVCVAPAASTTLLKAVQAGDDARARRILSDFHELEELRNEMGPTSVLHDAVSMSGIADMGPVLPNLSNLDPVQRKRVSQAVARLLDRLNDAAPRPSPASHVV
jgi:dihydrodipicolinate synthase/N-acetylneuraminate lyase